MQLRKQFGRDFVQVLLTSIVQPDGITPLADPAARLFLAMWGFSLDEIDEIFNDIDEKASRHQLGNPQDAFQRLVSYVKDDPHESEQLLVHALAMSFMNMKKTQDGAMFSMILGDAFSLKPDQLEKLSNQGGNIAACLHYFGDIYTRTKSS